MSQAQQQPVCDTTRTRASTGVNSTSPSSLRTTIYKMKEGIVNNVDDLITESQETRR